MPFSVITSPDPQVEGEAIQSGCTYSWIATLASLARNDGGRDLSLRAMTEWPRWPRCDGAHNDTSFSSLRAPTRRSRAKQSRVGAHTPGLPRSLRSLAMMVKRVNRVFVIFCLQARIPRFLRLRIQVLLQPECLSLNELFFLPKF